MVKTDNLGRSCSWVGCDSVGYVYPVGIASPLPPPKEGELQVYPNPATNQLHITSNIQATFILYDLLGRAVRQVGLGSGTVQVSVLGLPAGTYFYQIINPQKQILQHDKLIVLH
ncbi:MAG: T9SS type A sorting domain-containing protein [Sphingobacteriales bacterium]|nr:T9SS type A sorting domain-containing protein [Sphingobacteriales bacterium]